LNEWIKEVEKHAKDNVSIIVVGNKADKKGEEEREVSDIDIQKFSKDTGIRVFEASAKSGLNVETAFLSVTNELIEK
jgi:GTPase SAR1 family protein